MEKLLSTDEYNPFEGDVQYIRIENSVYSVKPSFVGKETLSDIIKRRIIKEYTESAPSLASDKTVDL